MLVSVAQTKCALRPLEKNNILLWLHKQVSRFPRERINLITLGTYNAYSRAILVIESYNGDLCKINRGYCQ